ncbi:WhiB family transcriptional regulator [Microbacterium azadirachtae]|uniref:WhiB family transcriptional regulator n=1 Tax=Microbacterium azadirachtae TaxID=582680 RepID=UPI000886F9BB|nr:WhiB family transcriptional regulator [Microbacterium azadirachtae]SDL30277.1 WhiB family transcriptional regulator, redox-sensing transcriptional regulator [Microbacterium azadirachtae]SEF60387.1 WhiB family transcriptional regulator, redox-sensing transcriptional regulator [Microbacterium azadirachtae]SEF61006.1 WhiB family transcriptional regulator, redox-sensing transcriptional regulator [Microbacterium azadirachtae]
MPHDTRTAAALAWQSNATCAEIGGDAWFPEQGEPSADAIAVCTTCPARTPCLLYALNERIDYGIWGGRTAHQRAQLLRELTREAA